MAELEFIFDRTIGKAIPESMRQLGLKSVYHHHIHPAKVGVRPKPGQKHLFKHDAPDDLFLEFAGQRGMLVVSQDHKYHLEEFSLAAINTHKVGVFYIWGANATKWETMRLIARTYHRMQEIGSNEQRPFIFKVGLNGQFRRVTYE